MPAPGELNRQYILDRVKVETDGCWNWTRAIDAAGYGAFTVAQRVRKAHRAAFEVFRGQVVPRGQPILHHCDNRRCCNPQHLYAGTMADNTADMMRRGRHKGFKISVRTPGFDERAADLRRSGLSHKVIASWLQCSAMTAYYATEG
jgi:HNH endonuclease